LGYDKRSKSEYMGIVPTEMELILEHTQQGISHEVSVSAEGVEELKRNVKIMKLKDGGEGTWFQLSHRFITTCSYPTIKYKDIIFQDFRYSDTKQLNLGVGTERMIFNINYAMKHSYSDNDACFNNDVIDEILEEDFDALLDEGSKILHSIERALLEEEIFAKFVEFMAMTADENSASESDNEKPPFEKITINTNYKSKHLLKNLLRVILTVFHDMIEESVEVFMVDFFVFGDAFNKCLNNLDKILQCCKDAHFVLKWERCHFMVKEGIVLGHKVSSARLEVDKAKIDVISKLPSSTNIKDTPSKFNDECQKAFEILKEKLTCAALIVSQNWNLPFELMCDASDFAVGAVLGLLADIPRLDTSKSNTYTLRKTSFKKRSSIKPKVPNVRHTYHVCAALTFKSKTVKLALTRQTEDEELKLMKETPYELLEDDEKKKLGMSNESKMTIYNDLPRKEYEAKVTTIKKAKDLATLPLDELIGNVKVDEMVLDNDGIGSKTTKENVKSLALKAKVAREQTSDDSDIQGGSDEDIDEEEAKAFNFLARNFCKFFRKGNQFRRCNHFGNCTNKFGKGHSNNFGNKGGEISKPKGACYNYGIEGHFDSECRKPKENKAFIEGAWCDSEDADEQPNDATCLMDIVSKEVVFKPSSSNINLNYIHLQKVNEEILKFNKNFVKTFKKLLKEK
nr:retrovirus-related Pol polyprotein from transposon 17.6 [Tanacetum cinerariifolium]